MAHGRFRRRIEQAVGNRIAGYRLQAEWGDERFAASVIATRTSAPRSRSRRTSSGVLYAAIPPLTPVTIFTRQSHHDVFLLP